MQSFIIAWARLNTLLIVPTINRTFAFHYNIILFKELIQSRKKVEENRHMQYLPLFSNNLSVFAVLNYIPNVFFITFYQFVLLFFHSLKKIKSFVMKLCRILIRNIIIMILIKWDVCFISMGLGDIKSVDFLYPKIMSYFLSIHDYKSHFRIEKWKKKLQHHFLRVILLLFHISCLILR